MSVISIIKRLLLLISLVIVPVFSFSQDGGEKVSKKVKKAEQKKEARVQRTKKAEMKGRKRHEMIQDKATRKRMKRHRRGPIHVDAYDRRPFFIKRWLKKKER